MAVVRTSRTIAGIQVGGDAPVRIMAVLNVSPESFYGGSVRQHGAAMRDCARCYADEGADFIDIGAMSTAPYLDTQVDEHEELRRMADAVDAVVGAVAIPISADTSRPRVARAALAAGASIVNDVGGLRADGMGEVAADAAAVVLMAAPGSASAASQQSPIAMVMDDLAAAIDRADAAGVARDRIVIDPGIGFYTGSRWPAVEFSTQVLRHLDALCRFDHPLLVGVSRKSFVGALSGRKDASERLSGSLAATALAVSRGAAIVRTHDVAATLDAVRVARALSA